MFYISYGRRLRNSCHWAAGPLPDWKLYLGCSRSYVLAFATPSPKFLCAFLGMPVLLSWGCLQIFATPVQAYPVVAPACLETVSRSEN